MAKTTFATGNALTKKVYEEKLYRDTVKAAYFHRFMGESSDSVVSVKSNLEKQQGDRITFGLRMRLTGAGVTSGTTLEGNEESLTTHDYSLSLEQYRHAVRDAGAIDRQRAQFSIDKEAELALKDWGSEKIDTLCFEALEASRTRILYHVSGAMTAETTPATAKAALTVAANSLITPGFISQIKTYAKTGGNRATIPLRPIKFDGQDWYILLVHPDVMFDLKNNSAWLQANREAENRGKDNPIFRGASAIYDGVVVHEHETCSIDLVGGAGAIPFADCSLLGAQALCWAWGQRPELVMESFDYGNQHGYAWGMLGAVGKPVFNSEDFGSLGVYVSRSSISDA